MLQSLQGAFSFLLCVSKIGFFEPNNCCNKMSAAAIYLKIRELCFFFFYASISASQDLRLDWWKRCTIKSPKSRCWMITKKNFVHQHHKVVKQQQLFQFEIIHKILQQANGGCVEMSEEDYETKYTTTPHSRLVFRLKNLTKYFLPEILLSPVAETAQHGSEQADYFRPCR